MPPRKVKQVVNSKPDVETVSESSGDEEPKVTVKKTPKATVTPTIPVTPTVAVKYNENASDRVQLAQAINNLTVINN